MAGSLPVTKPKWPRVRRDEPPGHAKASQFAQVSNCGSILQTLRIKGNSLKVAIRKRSVFRRSAFQLAAKALKQGVSHIRRIFTGCKEESTRFCRPGHLKQDQSWSRGVPGGSQPHQSYQKPYALHRPPWQTLEFLARRKSASPTCTGGAWKPSKPLQFNSS